MDLESGRIWIQTDSQQVEQAFAGRSIIDPRLLRPVCIRIARRLFSVLQAGFSPRLDTVPFVEWDKRELNTVADHPANVALDLQRDWQHDSGYKMVNKTSYNWRFCIDGARRGIGDASAGLALIAYSTNGEEQLVHRAGKQLGHLDSAFVAEIMPLEWGLDHLISFLNM